MSLNIKGDSKIYLQPGSTVTENDDGTVTGTCVFEGSFNEAQNAPPIGAQHPYDSRLEMTQRQFEILPLEKARITASYFGISNDTRRVSYQSGSASQDIQLHPSFEKFAGTPEAPKNGATWDRIVATNEDGSEGEITFDFLGFFLPKEGGTSKFTGTTDYLTPSGTVEVSYYTSRRPKSKRIPTIQASVSGWSKPKGIKNILLTDMPYRQIGRSHYQVTEVYLCSDEKGWNADIYK